MINSKSPSAFSIILLSFMLTLCVAAVAKPAQIQVITGRVVGVHDGDTLTLLTPANVSMKVRLAEIDAPESKQPFGQASKQALSALVFGQQVIVYSNGQDRYKRTLGIVVRNGMDVNLEMVRLGLAWRYEAYSKNPFLLQAQNEAQKAMRGLWREPLPVPPWEWRKGKHPG